ncbi:hypothetical protein P3X46_012174 [Hevea brasiliensis]|uniref:Reverse transcriptase domain-containing protein n=1 Tax=Hevea brasiliensis TaxID=3981 RepID=A0ABQ9M9E8_HEVBR|nr:hypothetical protein P3X46_012174 [Hevea brasiliensis]
MQCVTSVSYKMALNGIEISPIIPQRGLHFIFFKADTIETSNVKNILAAYKNAYGLVINFQKYEIFFSVNCSAKIKHEISDILLVRSPLDHGKYLGLPSLVDRLWKWILGWHSKRLSRTGKEVLLKSIAQAIPSYCISVFCFPISTYEDLQRMMNSFWWGSKPKGHRNIHWFS